MSVDPLILFGVVIGVTFLGNALFEKTRMPDTVFLIAIGVLLGLVFGIDPSESLHTFMSSFGAAALAVILFRTGLEFDVKRMTHHAGRAILLALFSFSIALFLVYCAMAVALDLHGPSAWAISAALACVSSGIALPVLARAHPGEDLSSLLSMESALTEALAMIAVLAISGLGGAQSAQPGFWGRQGLSFLIGAGTGLIVGFLWLWLLRFLEHRGFFYLLTIGLVFLLMSIVERSGGSGVLAILVFGGMLANGDSILGALAPSLRERFRTFSGSDSIHSAITEPQEQIYFLIRGFFLLYLGILLRWPGSDLRTWLGIGVASMAVIVGRGIAVQLAGWTTGIPGKDRAMLRIATPRGLTTAILVAMLIPRIGSGAWISVAVAIVLASNLWMILASAKHIRSAEAKRPGA